MDETTKKLELEVEADPQNKDKLRELIQHYERIGWTHRGKSIQEWIEALESGDDDEEIDAAAALKELGPKAFQARDILCGRLSHHDDHSRNDALEVLMAMGEPTKATREYFLNALGDSYERVSLNAAFALKISSHNLLGMWNEKTPGELKTALHSEDWQIRAFALTNLFHNIEDEPDLLPELLALFNDQEEELQEALSTALENAYYEDSVNQESFFEQFRGSSDDHVKAGLLIVMLKVVEPSDECLSLLVEALQSDMIPEAKAKLLRSLVEFHEPLEIVLPTLLALSENEQEESDLRLAIFEVLHSHRELPDSSKPAFLALLKEQLGNDESKMALGTGRTMMELGEIAIQPTLECLSSADDNKVIAAIQALGYADESAETVIPALLALLKLDRPKLWEPALDSLCSLAAEHVEMILASVSELLTLEECPPYVNDALQSLAFEDLDAFLSFLQASPSPKIQLALIEVIGELLGEDDDEALLEALQGFVDDKNEEVQKMARDLLDQFR